jgi:hypothetical protein
MIDRPWYEKPYLTKLGFCISAGSVHTARTIMLQELQELLATVPRVDASKEEYSHAVVEQNCLKKRSQRNRILTMRHLSELYVLDPSVLLFRALVFFWQHDVPGRPLLALLCAYARDPLLRDSLEFIMKQPIGAMVHRTALEEYLDALMPGRFSAATLKSVAQNLNASWTYSGHLAGKVKKVRTQAIPTAGSIAYALLLSYLTGARGQMLLKSEFIALLDCTAERALELAEEASKNGWMVFKRIGDVIEVGFPSLLTQAEVELLYE